MPTVDLKGFQHSTRLCKLTKLLRMSLMSILSCLCLVVLFSSFAVAQGNVIKMAAFNYPPFYYEDEGELYGIGVDLVREVFGRLDMQVEITLYPLSRALTYVKSGAVDGIMILIKNPEREEYIDYTEPVLIVRGLLWSAANREEGAVSLESLAGLKDYKVGVTRGYSYGHEFDELLKTLNVDVANADLFSFRKLLTGRIDVFPANEIVAKGLFKQYPDLRGKFVHSEEAFVEWVLHMGISKQSHLVSMIPEINRVLSDMKKSGSINEAVRCYTE